MATIRAAIGKVARVSRSRNPSRRELYKSLSTQSQTQAQAPEEPSLSLYCWGTNDKGSIPTKDVLKDGKSGGSGGAGNLLNRGGTIVDHPAKIDLHDAFGACVLIYWICSRRMNHGILSYLAVFIGDLSILLAHSEFHYHTDTYIHFSNTKILLTVT